MIDKSDEHEMLAAEQLVRLLLAAIPEVRPVCERHVARVGRLDGPEFFSIDLASWIMDGFVQSKQAGNDRGPWRDTLEVLDGALAEASDRRDEDPVAENVVSLISVDLAVMFPLRPKPHSDIRDYFGPGLRSWVPEEDLEMREEGRRFVLRIMQEVPAIEQAYRDYFDEGEDEDDFRAHTFFSAYLTEWVVDQFVAAGSPAPPVGQGAWKDVLDVLEREWRDLGRRYKQDEVAHELLNILGLSFLDSLPEEGERGHGIVEHLGPEMRRAYGA